MRRHAIVTFVLVLVAATVWASSGFVVILKSGHMLRCKEPMRIEGSNAILILNTGVMASYPLELVDLIETERYNKQGFGDAFLIEELTVGGTPLPTSTPRTSLGDFASIDAASRNPELGSAAPPTPTPTPGIKLQSYPYHDQRVDQAFTKIFDQQNLYLYRTSGGTKPRYYFVQSVTDSEREVFTALQTVAEAFSLIHRLHPDMAPEAVELEMVSTSGKAAGTFRLTPELAGKLASKQVGVQQFYVDNVIF